MGAPFFQRVLVPQNWRDGLVLEDPLTIYEGVFRFASPLAASVVSICEGRPTMGHFHSPDHPDRELWKVWVRFHKKKGT